MKYGDFFNGKKIILFNIDQTIRESKNRRRFVVEPDDIQLRMNVRRRLVKIKHLGYTIVGISIQPELQHSYQYDKDIFKEGFFLTQQRLGPGKFDDIFFCAKSKDDTLSDKIIEELNNYEKSDILYITEDGRDWNFARKLGIDSQWSTRFFAKIDEIRII
jgi:histidinol phosphatase-like enzyme